MAANFLKANNHKQGKVFFNSNKAVSLFYFTVKCFFSGPASLTVKCFRQGEKLSFPAVCLQDFMPALQSHGLTLQARWPGGNQPSLAFAGMDKKTARLPFYNMLLY